MLGRWLLLRERQYLQECMHHVLLDSRANVFSDGLAECFAKREPKHVVAKREPKPFADFFANVRLLWFKYAQLSDEFAMRIYQWVSALVRMFSTRGLCLRGQRLLLSLPMPTSWNAGIFRRGLRFRGNSFTDSFSNDSRTYRISKCGADAIADGFSHYFASYDSTYFGADGKSFCKTYGSSDNISAICCTKHGTLVVSNKRSLCCAKRGSVVCSVERTLARS